MKLDQIMETLVSSVKKYGRVLPIFKNPTKDELKEVMAHGVIRGIVSQKNVYVFDWNKLSYDDIPKINGLRINLFFKNENHIDIEVSSANEESSQENAEEIIRNNDYLKDFNIDKVIVSKNKEFI